MKNSRKLKTIFWIGAFTLMWVIIVTLSMDVSGGISQI